LLLLVIMLAVTLGASSAVTAWMIDHTLTMEFQSKGRAIGDSIATASVEMLLNRDPASVQTMIDERRAGIPGVSYILVLNDQGDSIAHTFVPVVPEWVKRLGGNPHETVIQEVREPGVGDSIDICSPILAGQVGYVHVGMDRAPIRAGIWDAIVKQTLLLVLLFPLGAWTAYFLSHTDQGPGETVGNAQ
jgi:sensor histidine kinase regulating citrate/malate metabolism